MATNKLKASSNHNKRKNLTVYDSSSKYQIDVPSLHTYYIPFHVETSMYQILVAVIYALFQCYGVVRYYY